MPFTATRVGLTAADLSDPAKNIRAGTRLLAVLLRYYDSDLISALVAYNARPRRLFAPIPRNGETPRYVSAVLHYFGYFSRAQPGFAERPGAPGNPGFTNIDTGSAHSGPVGSMGFIEQALATTPGGNYQLCYWLRNLGPPSDEFQVTWDGNVIRDDIDLQPFDYTQNLP
jgi:hypothetical protein